MAKRKNITRNVPDIEKPRETREPKLTHAAFQAAFWIVVVGFLAQVIMAFVVYPILPAEIPSGFAGSASPHNTIPSWLVFLLFPGGTIVLLLLAIITPKDDKGRRVMESGKAVSLILLALLFTALQYSAFHIPRMG